jgi:hypothetical protein
MSPICFPETPVRNNHYSSRNNPGERVSAVGPCSINGKCENLKLTGHYAGSAGRYEYVPTFRGIRLLSSSVFLDSSSLRIKVI